MSKDSDVIKQKHVEIFYPIVRVSAEGTGGSGTVIYSKENKEGEFDTFILTNHHVVESAIKVKKEWNPLTGKHEDKEYRSTVVVEFFRYKYLSQLSRSYSVEGDIVAWDKDQDLALIKLRDPDQVDYVAELFPHEKVDVDRGVVKEIHIGDAVYAVGAALGHPPIMTTGHINFMDDEIDNEKYWLSTAPTIFGNSGGAVFRQSEDGHWRFIGVPARIAVTISGFMAQDAITHMGWFIPIFRVYKFLKENFYHFIYDNDVSPEECERMRKEKRKRAQIEALLEAQKKVEEHA